ncbi:hypothetical protein DEO72_LG2g2982 [Vigna unguiculata]|uniref:Uncharacterized protein n=1 Tax=Vigna unguiculata TaxID=3917 RepID=A0A4D6L2B1_VIGUN|nr:hypothetical protein DEO72_LG2g2982 [Vigna unguiculata]
MALAFSRLGETSSLERDGLSLKTGARHLSDSSREVQGALLALLLGRALLAWVKTPGSSTVHACNNQPFEPNDILIDSLMKA